ncbi:16S rRNA m2G966 methyltransferase [Synechococcus sp. MEDNS5]|nr:16S rRNA m2G966 methyltransferase [Synechococcus sp. MEDNS5]
MRMIGGRRLRSPQGQGTRPTTARVREALMNVLADGLEDAHWLDLFSGSGVMGCEAIQRGAARVWAVENNARIAAVCRQNLELVSASRGELVEIRVIRRDLMPWLDAGRPVGVKPFTHVYVDPPYAADHYESTLERLQTKEWITSDGIVICEYASENKLDPPASWTEVDRRRYGTSSLLFLSPREHCRGGTGSKQPQTNPEG